MSDWVAGDFQELGWFERLKLQQLPKDSQF